MFRSLIFAFGLSTTAAWAQTEAPLPQPEPTPAPSPVPAPGLEPLKTIPVTLSILTDSNGLTVYTFDRDAPNVSNCTGGCARVWPPVLTDSESLPAPLSVIRRADGSKQVAHKGHALYLYADDEKAGDLNGDGIGGVWHVVRP